MNKFDNFNDFVSYRVLAQRFKSSPYTGYSLSDSEFNDSVKRGVSAQEYKNVCAKLPINLVDRLDKTLQFLDVRKRGFIELVVTDALERIDNVIREHGMYEFFSEGFLSMESLEEKTE